ncbi:unnamed protein product [Rotaria magnacalcarata]|uniref:Hydrogen voltage-gated channel 1 n=2 Tax=Rotaria magnacalcarata TaxID=392030 RepID=A0A814Y4V7_9BILA|nr:unnamed protein product [Rotaria magnacalcarata]
MQMIRIKKKDKIVLNEKRNISSSPKKCNSIRWDRGYRHQRVICGIIQSFYFRVLIIFLVIFDISLLIAEIMLDTLKMQYECKLHVNQSSHHSYEITKEHAELATETTHYSSIVILSFFLIEVLVRICARGKEFWNSRRNKIEYLDAFIIDLYSLQYEKKILSKKLLIFSFRLWRFVKIINSVAEGVHDGNIKHKRREYFNSILSYFRLIDDKYKSSLNRLEKNHELSSSTIVTQFIKESNEFEDRNDDEMNSKLFVKSSEV